MGRFLCTWGAWFVENAFGCVIGNTTSDLLPPPPLPTLKDEGEVSLRRALKLNPHHSGAKNNLEVGGESV